MLFVDAKGTVPHPQEFRDIGGMSDICHCKVSFNLFKCVKVNGAKLGGAMVSDVK